MAEKDTVTMMITLSYDEDKEIRQYMIDKDISRKDAAIKQVIRNFFNLNGEEISELEKLSGKDKHKNEVKKWKQKL